VLEAVHLIIGARDGLDAWAARVARVVRPGGTVVVERPPAPFRQALRFLHAAAQPDTADNLVKALRARGFSAHSVDFSTPVAPGVPLWVLRSRSAVVVGALLHRADSVLWSDGGSPLHPLGVWVPDDPRRIPQTAATISEQVSDHTLHVFAPRTNIDDIIEARDILAIDTPWELHAVDGRGPELVPAVRTAVAQAGVSWLCVGLAAEGLRTPLLAVLHTLEVDLWVVSEPSPSPGSGTLEASDAIAIGTECRATILRCIGPLVWTPDDTALHRVFQGATVGPVTLSRGQVRWNDPEPGVHGLCTDPTDPAGSLVAAVHVLPRAGPPIVLVGWPGPYQSTLREQGMRVWACLFTPQNPEALRDEGLVDAVLHPDAVLDRGTPTDLPDSAREVTLRRMVRVLRMAGYPVVGHLEVDTGAVHPTVGPAPLPENVPLPERLVARCNARPTRFDHVDWLLDGQAARLQLLHALDHAVSQIDFQVYIFEVDPIGSTVRDALVRAARRGVTVRVLVDAVWSGHGAFSRENPLLADLARTPNTTVASSRPVGTMVDLKARDHRKLVVVDDRLAVLPGRNVGAHYYTGFDEVALAPDTDQRAVPWFDLTTVVTGPIVREAAWSFACAWSEARGSTPPPPPPVSPTPNAWWVAHHSLQDAHGLDTFRELLSRARSRVVVVNTFAIQHELQHALHQCLERGVAVDIYTGHVRPRFADGTTPFVGSRERDLATGVIHGRFETLVAAGARAFALGVRSDRWHPDLRTVLPHVHSKLLIVDDRWVVAGSHNIDIASAYWESEVVLVLDAPEEAHRLRSWLTDREPLARAFHDSVDGRPAWRDHTAQPEWLSQHWPSLLS